MNDPSTSSLTPSSMKKSPAWLTAVTQRRHLRRVSAWAAGRTAATIWVTRSTGWERRETPKCTWRPVLRCPIKVGPACLLVSKTGTFAQLCVRLRACCRWQFAALVPVVSRGEACLQFAIKPKLNCSVRKTVLSYSSCGGGGQKTKAGVL